MREHLPAALIGGVVGAILGIALALLLTSPTQSRQASTPRPAATIPATLRPVTPLRTGAPTDVLVMTPQPTTGTQPAPEGTPATAIPSPGHTPKPTKRPRATTRPAHGLSGLATWYPAGGPIAAAGPALRAALGDDWRGQTVRVCSGGECVTVELVDWCACGPRHGEETLLDLSIDAFDAIADPSAGVIDVRVTIR